MGLSAGPIVAGAEVLPQTIGVAVIGPITKTPLTVLYCIGVTVGFGGTICTLGSSIDTKTLAPAEEIPQRRAASATINKTERRNCMCTLLQKIPLLPLIRMWSGPAR
jgi:hypothetical protein